MSNEDRTGTQVHLQVDLVNEIAYLRFHIGSSRAGSDLPGCQFLVPCPKCQAAAISGSGLLIRAARLLTSRLDAPLLAGVLLTSPFFFSRARNCISTQTAYRWPHSMWTSF